MIPPALEAASPCEARAEQIAAYVLERVRARHPHTWRQARRRPEGEISRFPASAGAHLDTFRTFRITGISELAFAGLALVLRDFPVRMSRAALEPTELLALQARGARCVTLLPDDVKPPGPHADGLDFVIHDLCHLAKFADPEHHVGQVGFFATVARAFADARFRSAEADLDEIWREDRAAVSADMNGSPVFLLAVLKMRLKMAARRSLARRKGVEPPTVGPATGEEELEFRRLLAPLLDAMDLPEPVRAAAVSTSARRDDPDGARLIVSYFEAVGRAVTSS